MRNVNLENVHFLASTLTNVVMNNASLKQVKFKNSKLISTDPNIDNSYNGLVADEILFDTCELKSLGFFEAKSILRFENSTLYDVDGEAMKNGSSLYFHKTHASIINFDGSNFDTIEIIDSTIDKRSTAGGGQVKTIRVENSKLEFAVSDNSNVDSIEFNNSGNVVISGGENVKTTHVKNCLKGSRTVMVGSENFERIEVDGCDVAEIVFGRSTGKTVIIKNVTTHDMDFRESNIEHLVLENVKIYRKLKHQNTTINQLEVKNITFRKGVKVWNENSNIKITPDTWLEE